MGFWLGESSEQHLPPLVCKENLQAWKETLPQAAPPHTGKGLQKLSIHRLGTYLGKFGFFALIDVSKERGTLTFSQLWILWL